MPVSGVAFTSLTGFAANVTAARRVCSGCEGVREGCGASSWLPPGGPGAKCAAASRCCCCRGRVLVVPRSTCFCLLACYTTLNYSRLGTAAHLDLGVGVAHGAAVVGADVGHAALAECQPLDLQQAEEMRGEAGKYEAGNLSCLLASPPALWSTASDTEPPALYQLPQHYTPPPCTACRRPPPW